MRQGIRTIEEKTKVVQCQLHNRGIGWLFLALLGIGDSEGDVYLLAAGIFAFVAILMFGTAGTKKKRIKAQLRDM